MKGAKAFQRAQPPLGTCTIFRATTLLAQAKKGGAHHSGAKVKKVAGWQWRRKLVLTCAIPERNLHENVIFWMIIRLTLISPASAGYLIAPACVNVVLHIFVCLVCYTRWGCRCDQQSFFSSCACAVKSQTGRGCMSQRAERKVQETTATLCFILTHLY